MFNISPLEIMVIAVIALIVLGPARLPEVARSVGRGMREFRGALAGVSGHDDDDDEDDYVEDDEIVDPPALPKSPPGAEEDDYQNEAESKDSSSSSSDLV